MVQWFGIQKLRVGESHCALLAFCPWLHCREPSQCWWIWEDGERQAETLPVNQQGCLAPLLHSLGDKICVILPWGISPRRCLHPPFTVPSPLHLTLFLHVSLHNSTSLLFSSLPVSLSAYPSSAQPAASHLPIYSCGFAALQCLTATPCNPADLSFAGLFLFLKHDRHSLLHLFVLTLSQKSWSKTTSKAKQNRTTAKKKQN